MLLNIKRVYKGSNYTIGRLLINGVYFCDTLEDTVRDTKIYGETAIPAGLYEVDVVYSPRFKRHLPHIKNVPNFLGIMIHPGNTAKDTKGCILVGKNTEKGKVLESKDTFNALFAKIKDQKDIKIQIS